MNFLSLFSGIGGLDLGLERAGMKCMAQVEVDPFCRKVLAKHWPNVPRFEDVRTVTRESLAGIGGIDCIAGGFPCQDISVAGRRAGLAGERSGLWREYHRIIREVQPRFALVENVSALLIPDGSGLAPIGVVLGDLAASGYDAEWNCISAEGFGAPHKRERIFILAHRDKAEYLRTDEPIRPNPDSDFWMDLKKEQEWGRGFDKLVAMGIAERRGSYSENLRMVDGIPDAMDRIGGCGNAVTPQVAEWIGKRIMEVAKP